MRRRNKVSKESEHDSSESANETPTVNALSASIPLSHRQILAVVSGLVAGMLLAAVDQTIVSTALPTIVGDLGGLDRLSWIVTSYLLTSTTAVPLCGKLGDVCGRRQVFQAAIVVFLVGSILSGVAQDMSQLVLFRGIQGAGAGGLMAMSMTILGEVVSPRDRGRYTGYMIAVFALASVGGPAVGGFFVDTLSWRWIFYINLPIGAAALTITSVVLRLPFRRVRHKIDFSGAALLTGAVTCTLLLSVWAGGTYPWKSWPIVGLAIAAGALASLFVVQERRVSEPILPLRLFSVSIFSVTSALSFCVGAALFGALVFLPLFLQVVMGATPTRAGFLLFPLIGGLMLMSVLSGQLVARTGHYRSWPIVGMGTATLGMFLLSRMTSQTGRAASSVAMAIVGMGLGMVMQVLILAAQNAVPQDDLGVATSALNFFRQMGATLGVSAFGAIFAARLQTELGGRLSAREFEVTPDGLATSPAQIGALPDAVRNTVIEAVANSVQSVFIWSIPVVFLGFILSWRLQQQPLRDTVYIGRSAFELNEPSL